MKVYFIGAGPGAADLMTLRGLKVIQQSKICIYAGSLVSTEHLKSLPKDAEVYNSAHMSLEQIGAVFLNAKNRNDDVARLHTGDPALFSAIGEQIAFCCDNGIDCEIIPGVSSFSACAALLNKELTVPGITQTVILTRCEGRTPVPERERLHALAQIGASMCIFLSIAHIDSVVHSLRQYYQSDTPVAVVYRATWPDQKVIIGTLDTITSTVTAQGIKKTAMILVGNALGMRGAVSKLYDAHFSHEYRTGRDDNAQNHS